jgi:hypothetical protein
LGVLWWRFRRLGSYASAAERQRRQLTEMLRSRFGTSETNALFTDMWWVRLPLLVVAAAPPVYLLRRAPRGAFVFAALYVGLFTAVYIYAVGVSTFSDIYSFGEVVAGLAAARTAKNRRDAVALLVYVYLAVVVLGPVAASIFLVPYGPVVTFPNPYWDLAVKYFVAFLSAAFSGLIGMPTATAVALAVYKPRA